MDKATSRSDNYQPHDLANALVALYLTEETGLPCDSKAYDIVPFEALDSLGTRIERRALRVTFDNGTSIRQPHHLLTFGSDDQHCNIVLKATEASPIHCRIYAQLNSGPNIWVIDDTSSNGTRYVDEESLRTRIPKRVARGRVAAQGLHRIQIGRNIFTFWSPSDIREKSQRERYFQNLDPIPVTQRMLQEQLRGMPADYCLIGMVGHGGMGHVFQYMEMTTGLMIAVKEEDVKNRDEDERVQREIEYMQVLKHPNLVEYIGNKSTTNAGVKKWSTAMPLYQGRLSDILPLEISAIESIMLQLFEGVAYMHARRILHKDIKPENILVKSKSLPDVVLADYGLCASLNNRADLMGPGGTPGFAAPEVSRMVVQTEAVDVFAMGATFFFILEPQRCNGRYATIATLGNVMQRPPQLYGGLVQVMMAPEAEKRPSLKECFDIVKARKRDWRKLTPLAHPLPSVPSTPGPRRSQRLQKALVQQPPITHLERCAAHRPRLAQLVEKRPAPQGPGLLQRPGLQQGPERPSRARSKTVRLQGPKALDPPLLAPRREPQVLPLVQRVNFAARPPPSPENPFANLGQSRAPIPAPPIRRQRPPATQEPIRTPIQKPDYEIKRQIRRGSERRDMIQRWHKIRLQKNKICHAAGEIGTKETINIFHGLRHITAGGLGFAANYLGLVFSDLKAAKMALRHISPQAADYWGLNTNKRLAFGLKPQSLWPMTPEEYEAERLQSKLYWQNETEKNCERARPDPLRPLDEKAKAQARRDEIQRQFVVERFRARALKRSQREAFHVWGRVREG